MKHRPGRQARRAGIALAAAAAFAALGIGTAQAAQFTRADITLDSAGNLTCGFRETGLGALSLVTYDCGALALGVVSGCFVKNKFVGPFAVSISKDVTTHESNPLLAKNNGAINGSITVEVPEGGGGEVQCNHEAGAEPQVVAVRWCNASLMDVTNNIVGATSGQLTDILLRTGDQVAPIPTCTEILAAPGDGGEG